MTITPIDLVQNYKDHPAFNEQQDEFHFDEAILEKFESTYSILRNFGSQISKVEFEKLSKLCSSYMVEVFEHVKVQASDKFEKLFWEELQVESLRLLKEEFSCYRGSRNNNLSFKSVEELELANRLKEHKFSFGRLAPEVVRAINEIGASNLRQFRENAKNGLLKREDLSSNSNEAVSKIIAVLNKEFDRNGVNAAVTAYMGKKMVVVGLAHELSIPQAKWWESKFEGLTRAPHTLYAHLDESILFPKAIVYLTDVANDNGPTSCYPGLYDDLKLGFMQQIVGRVLCTVGSKSDSPLKDYYQKTYHQSVSSAAFRRHYMIIPTKIRFNSHLGWDIVPDSNIEKEMISREVFLTGEAGSFIVFDGARLFHRGGLMKSGERVVLQVVFGQHPSALNSIKAKIKRFFRHD